MSSTNKKTIAVDKEQLLRTGSACRCNLWTYEQVPGSDDPFPFDIASPVGGERFQATSQSSKGGCYGVDCSDVN